LIHADVSEEAVASLSVFKEPQVVTLYFTFTGRAAGFFGLTL